MKHPDYVEGFNGSLEDLAKAVGNMRYDKVEEFIEALADDIVQQAEKDKENGKTCLATRLYETADKLYSAQNCIGKAWKISRPYMEE